MEFNQIKIEDATGKTIESVVLSSIDDEILIKYTDGSFSFLQYRYNSDSIPDIVLKYETMIYDVCIGSNGNLRFSSEIRFLIDNGIVDKEKLSEKFIEKNKERMEYEKNKEYQTYLKLKEKFDGKSN